MVRVREYPDPWRAEDGARTACDGDINRDALSFPLSVLRLVADPLGFMVGTLQEQFDLREKDRAVQRAVEAEQAKKSKAKTGAVAPAPAASGPAAAGAAPAKAAAGPKKSIGQAPVDGAEAAAAALIEEAKLVATQLDAVRTLSPGTVPCSGAMNFFGWCGGAHALSARPPACIAEARARVLRPSNP